MSGVHVYTSITSNYLPKARVLGHSIKNLYPEVTFHLVLNDSPPQGFDLACEPFDSLILIEDLPIPDLLPWVFGHTVVELCTAVKGAALEHIFEKYEAEKVFYFDPDMAVFGRLENLTSALDRHSIVLTPHQSVPEDTVEAVADNEIASLKHGVFNLGFIGVKNSKEGLRFSRWWADRLYHFCHNDIPGGLFTDQRWIDLVPCFFDDYLVLRDPGFNVATWNLTHRHVHGSFEEGFKVNEVGLGFYHFSGFDSGAQEIMLGKYGKNNPALMSLRDWYIGECEKHGQSELGQLPSKFAAFADGTPIHTDQRRLYRNRIDLKRAFPNPFQSDPTHSYQAWYASHFDPHTQRKGVFSVAPEARYAEVLTEFLAFTQERASMSHRLSSPMRWVLTWAVNMANRLTKSL